MNWLWKETKTVLGFISYEDYEKYWLAGTDKEDICKTISGETIYLVPSALLYLALVVTENEGEADAHSWEVFFPKIGTFHILYQTDYAEDVSALLKECSLDPGVALTKNLT